MKTLLLLISIFAIIAGEVDGINIDALPTDVKAELQRAVDSATRARAVYLQAIQQANERANLQLERLVATYTRRGNLDVALSIRNAQEKINNGWVKTQVEKHTDLVGNVISNPSNRIRIIEATWSSINRNIDVKRNIEGLINRENGTLSFQVTNGVWNMGDIDPGNGKTLRLILEINGVRSEHTFRELEMVNF